MITNFQTVGFSTLRDKLALAVGADAVGGQVTYPLARNLVRALNVATREAWETYPWEEVCPVLTALEVDAGSGRMVSIPGRGYQVLRVFSEDPEAKWMDEDDMEACSVPFRLGRRGDVILQGSLTTPYYLVKLAPPEWGAELWSETVDYNSGAVVYEGATDNSEQDCYRAERGNMNVALPTWQEWAESNDITTGEYYLAHGVLWVATDTGTLEDDLEPGRGAVWQSFFTKEHAEWAPQRLPKFLEEAVLAGAEAWLSRTMEGQPVTGNMVRKAMDEFLSREVVSRFSTRGQSAVTGQSLSLR